MESSIKPVCERTQRPIGYHNPIISAIQEKECLMVTLQRQQHLNLLTDHEQAVLEVVKKNSQNHHDWLKGMSLNRCLDDRTFKKLIEITLPQQFAALKSRHLIGIQAAHGPTGLLFCKNMYDPQKEINPENYCVEDVETAKRIRMAETLQDLKASFPRNSGLDQPTEIEKLEKIVYVVASREFESAEQISNGIDRQIYRTLECIAQDKDWDSVKNDFSNPVVYAHPDNQMEAIRRGFTPILDENVPQDWILAGQKYDEYHAPMYLTPYQIYANKDEHGKLTYRMRFGLTCPPSPGFPYDTLPSNSSKLVYKIKVDGK